MNGRVALAFLLTLAASTAHARVMMDWSAPGGGSIRPGNDTDACASTNSGAIRYSGGVLSYCNGSAWASLAAGSTSGTTAAAGVSGSIQFRNGSGALAGSSGLIWDAAGLLGIGTTTPDAPLTIVRPSISSGGIPTSPQTALALKWYDQGADTGTGEGLKIAFYGDINTNPIVPIEVASIATEKSENTETSALTDLVFRTHNGTAVSEALRIASSGNVGIGTAAPNSLLHIQSNDATAYAASGAASNPTGAARLAIENSATANDSAAYLLLSSRESGNRSNTGYIGVTATPGSYAPTMIFGSRTGNSSYAERMRIDPNGNIGIGNITPTAPITFGNTVVNTINENTSNDVIPNKMQLWGSAGATFGLGISTDDLDYFSRYNHRFYVGSTPTGRGTEAFTVLANGNVGIGTSSPTSKFTVEGAGVVANIGGTAGGILQVRQINGKSAVSAASDNLFLNYGTGFNVNVGGGPGTSLLTVFGPASTCTIGNGTGATNCTSDIRLKKDIQPISGALEKLALIKGVTFHWKDPKKAEPEHLGVIAQDVEKVFPQAVTTISDTTLPGGTAKAVDYAVLVAPLIEAVKELKDRNEALRADVEAIQADFAAYKAAHP